MAPKLWKGIKGKAKGKAKAVVKKPALAKAKAVAKAKAAAPSTIKGLAGFRKASFIFTGAVDRGVSQQNAPLASRAAVLEGLDARLICINPAMNSDKYYVLQGLVDPKVPEGKPKRCYAYQRWGRTGTGGVCRLQGPMELNKVERHLFKVLKAKTGTEWGSLKPGEKAKPGMYWLAVPSEADPRALWEYFVEDGVDHKCNGWYPYESDASKQVEELYAEHTANKKGSNSTAKRFVPSGKFTYCLELDQLSQRNTSTGKERKIRRSLSSKSTRPETPASPGASPCETCPGLFRADTAETIPAAWSEAELNAKTANLPVCRLASSSSASSIPGLPGKRARKDVPPVPTSTNDMLEVAHRGEVEKLSQAVLKSWLSSRSIATSGRKPDLVDRVYSILEEI